MTQHLLRFGAYSNQRARYPHIEEAPTLLFPPNEKSQLAITRLTSNTGVEQSARIPRTNAFLIAISMHPTALCGRENWIDGKHSRTSPWSTGGVGIYDLETGTGWRLAGAFDVVQYQLSRTMLNRFTDDRGLSRVDTLLCLEGIIDPELRHMTQMILPSLGEPDLFSQLFLDHFCLMLCAHLVSKYSVSASPATHLQGGLSTWQKRRVTELIDACLDQNLKLTRMADECGLSVGHFARSFKTSFGMSAHKHLVLQRVKAAKALLAGPNHPLSDIALKVGFSDQAALSRIFKRITGTTPKQWRAEIRSRKTLGEGLPKVVKAPVIAIRAIDHLDDLTNI